ncbi:MAG: hypothetical protein IRY98_01785 [Alicyclobacillaceae bacterium]|nr:hypothetical protein [Alicyclobacillaceae bacterium]
MHPIPAACISLIVAFLAGRFLGLNAIVCLAIGGGAIAVSAILRSLYQEVERRVRAMRHNR